MPTVERMLVEIEADIAAGDIQIVRQRELIADLESRGQSSAFAKGILKEIKAIQAEQIILRDRLRAEVTRRAWSGQALRAAQSRPRAGDAG